MKDVFRCGGKRPEEVSLSQNVVPPAGQSVKKGFNAVAEEGPMMRQRMVAVANVPKKNT